MKMAANGRVDSLVQEGLVYALWPFFKIDPPEIFFQGGQDPAKSVVPSLCQGFG